MDEFKTLSGISTYDNLERRLQVAMCSQQAWDLLYLFMSRFKKGECLGQQASKSKASATDKKASKKRQSTSSAPPKLKTVPVKLVEDLFAKDMDEVDTIDILNRLIANTLNPNAIKTECSKAKTIILLKETVVNHMRLSAGEDFKFVFNGTTLLWKNVEWEHLAFLYPLDTAPDHIAAVAVSSFISAGKWTQKGVKPNALKPYYANEDRRNADLVRQRAALPSQMLMYLTRFEHRRGVHQLAEPSLPEDVVAGTVTFAGHTATNAYAGTTARFFKANLSVEGECAPLVQTSTPFTASLLDLRGNEEGPMALALINAIVATVQALGSQDGFTTLVCYSFIPFRNGLIL